VAIWEALHKWKIQRRTLYAIAAFVILFHQTFIAAEAQTPLLGVALILLGLIPADIKDTQRREKNGNSS
jgi:uncharacterized membrane protein HdeD (DUF308 family)